MKLNKYEYRFVRMMIKMFSLVVAIIIVMKMINIPLRIIYITFALLLGLLYLIKMIYWNYLEGLEIQEEIGEVV